MFRPEFNPKMQNSVGGELLRACFDEHCLGIGRDVFNTDVSLAAALEACKSVPGVFSFEW
jgi:hypothetical protein